MAKFTIYSPSGTALYTGTPSFTGQYMKPGMLEFREVALPALVDLSPGCYVDYTRTGHRYRIYTAPQLKKQARSYSYGGAFVYQSVQLYDATKMLEYCPFRDLVLGDNRIHFSTQPSISTFEGCDGLARRFEACLVDQYGANSWRVRLATQAENPDLYDLMREPREFTVSGVNILECLDKVYEIWPEVGWAYKVESGIDTIVIGGGGTDPNIGTYAYGKGNGLTSLTRTPANADEIANRIFAYGSSRNMLPRWYNGQEIKDAESVDIQNLMLPVDAIPLMDWSGWGLTDGERDAAKAYVENTESITKNGLRPATVYFDGKGEYPEIYPTLRETTIAMVRTALGDSGAKYYPSASVYTNPSQRIDTILSAPASFDSGLAGDATGKTNVDSEYSGIDESDSTPFPAGYAARPILTYQGTYTPSKSGNFSISLGLNISGSITLADIKSVNVVAGISEPGDGGKSILTEAKSIEVEPGATSVTLHNLSFNANRVPIQSGVSYNVAFVVSVEAERSESDRPCHVEMVGGYSISLSNYRIKTFTVSIRQVGFDINEQANIGNGKTIAMRTGKCAGRSFAINSVQYDATTDSWALECWRTEDESLSQWFPNTDFPVEAGNEFVLLDIAMPDFYVQMAEQRLLAAAKELLADTATERWQYAPDIDAKFMVENGRTIRAGEYISLLDITAEDITPGVVSYFKTNGGGYFLTSTGDRIVLSQSSGSVITSLVDTVVINEGEAAIPTYKVTLRDRKRKTWTESQSPETSSSKSVGNITETPTQTVVSVGGGDSFFQLDGDGNVTLKPEYRNLWVPGWMAAGGVGEDSGGGGGVSYLRELTDVYHGDNGVLRADGTAAQDGDALVFNSSLGWVASPVSGGGGGGGGGADLSDVWNSLTNTVTDAYANTKINIAHIPITDLDTWVAGKGYALSSAVPTESTVAGWGFTKNAGTVTSVTLTSGTGITVSNSGTAITTSGTRTIGISSTYQTYITHGEAAYNSLSNYALAADLTALASRVTALETGAFFTLDGSGNVTLKAGYSNLWVPGWLSAGGTGSGSSGGGVDLNRVWDSLTNNTDKPNVTINPAHIPDLSGTYLTSHQTIYSLSVSAGAYTGGSLTYTPNSAAKSISIPTTLDHITDGTGRKLSNYLPLAGGTMTGAILMNGASIYPYSDLGASLGDPARRFNNGQIANIGTSTIYLKNSSNGNSGLINAGGGWLVIQTGANIDTSHKQLTFHETYGFYPENGSSVNLGYYNADDNRYRWANIYGVNEDLSGNLAMARTSTITIGPVTITYDAINKALHISGTDNNQTIGLYCDGWVASGGIQQGA